MLISIIMPSRLKPNPMGDGTELWLERAFAHVRKQSLWGRVDLEVCVGIDHGMTPPAEVNTWNLQVKWATAGPERVCQAAALNAAARLAQGDVVALLEDDDYWQASHLENALKGLADGFAFVSSNQVEITPEGKPFRYLDFATPAGWTMPHALWREIGPMNEDFRWHLDNEWLGRLNAAGKRRLHMVEAGAPVDLEEMRAKRPQLALVLEAAPEGSEVRRHAGKLPTVVRTANPEGGMAQIAGGGQARDQSNRERDALKQRFGTLPW